MTDPRVALVEELLKLAGEAETGYTHMYPDDAWPAWAADVARRAAALLAGPTAPQEWQTIATAPSGLLLLFFPEDDRNKLDAEMAVDRHPVNYPRKPTHWQPLPALPMAGPTETGEESE